MAQRLAQRLRRRWVWKFLRSTVRYRHASLAEMSDAKSWQQIVACDSTRWERLECHTKINDRIDISFSRYWGAGVCDACFKSTQLIERLGRELDPPIHS